MENGVTVVIVTSGADERELERMRDATPHVFEFDAWDTMDPQSLSSIGAKLCALFPPNAEIRTTAIPIVVEPTVCFCYMIVYNKRKRYEF